MSEIKAADVKKLRDKTGSGMMDCKKALAATDGNFDEAIDWLKKKGLAAASKKSTRAASQGLVAAKVDKTKGILIELNAETDFVARNDKFQELAQGILDSAILQDTYNTDLDNILKTKYLDKTNDIASEITENIAVIGENIDLRRVTSLNVSNGVVVNYIHNAIKNNMGKIAVLVAIESQADNVNKLQELAKNLAMHIAALNPDYLNIEDITQTIINKEKKIFAEQAVKTGKPANVVEKMVEGRIRKFYEEVVLLEQIFVIDNKKKIKDVINEYAKELGCDVVIKSFVRYELGEGIVHETNDFAKEVAAMQNNK